MKGRIVWSLYCFLRLQIYEAIAAIFWQSACYVVTKLCCFCKVTAEVFVEWPLDALFQNLNVMELVYFLLQFCGISFR